MLVAVTRTVRFAALLVATLIAASLARAEQPRSRCDPAGAEAGKALARLRAIDGEIESMEPDADVSPTLGRIRTLLESPCFARFRSEIRDLPETAPALRWWWTEAGAVEWFAFYLVDLEKSWGPSEKRRIAIPPTVRRELSLETAADSELAEVLCSRTDVACGAETLGWLLRAGQAFDSYSLSEGLIDPPFLDDEVAPAEERCAGLSGNTEGWRSGRYDSWRECIEHKLGLVDAFPIGRFRAPASGWILFEGRRGHYEFCDQLSIFDLESGSAILAKSCGGLVLMPGGSVDFEETSRLRETSIEFGRVSVDNLRELALLTILLPAIHRDTRSSWSSFEVPAGVPDDELTSDGTSMIQHPVITGTTTLEWTWLRDGRAPVRRTLPWGGWEGGAADHSTSLLAIVEASFQKGCVTRALPDELFNGLPSVHPGDADENELDRLFRDLRRRATSEVTSHCCPK